MPVGNLRGKLIDDEKVIKEWSTKDWTKILATNYRLFLLKNNFYNKQSIEIPYEKITSLEFLRRRPIERLIGAVALGLLYVVTLYISSSIVSYSFDQRYLLFTIYFAAVLLASIGFLIWFLIGVDSFAIHIAGRPPVYISIEIEELYYFIRLHLNSNAPHYPGIEKLNQPQQDLQEDYIQVGKKR
jgi:hypothetical protein